MSGVAMGASCSAGAAANQNGQRMLLKSLESWSNLPAGLKVFGEYAKSIKTKSQAKNA